MEHFNPGKLADYLEYARCNDLQILVNRRVARELYEDAFEEDGDFTFPVEKAEKIQTFLTMPDVHASGSSIHIYAFIRLMGDLKRSLRKHAGSNAPSEAGNPSLGG